MRGEGGRAGIGPLALVLALVATAALAVLLLFAVSAAAALQFPALAGRVTDAANILAPAARSAIETKLKDLEDRSSIQLVVATVPSLQESDVETYANGLFRAWRIGEAKKNNGLLLLVAPNERKARVEVGYGLEGTITDALSSVIIQSAMLPRFKAGDFSGGIDRGVDALISALSDDQSDWQKKARVRHEQDAQGLDSIMPLLIVALFLFVFFVMMRNARGGARRGGVPWIIPTGSWGGGGSDWGSGGGGFSGGGGGGGFEGGGGSSGGGGASGSW